MRPTLSAVKRIKLKAERRKEKLPLVLGFKPNPMELESTITEVEIIESYRFGECPGYRSCLDIAVLGNWQGMSCRACKVYQHKQPTAVTWTKRIRSIQDEQRKWKEHKPKDRGSKSARRRRSSSLQKKATEES